MSQDYNASSIEVLSGLDPVRRRPGMYTDTTRPNHLAEEVVDNSVDEATSGHCKRIAVTLFRDGSLQVEDDGRGMPVDVHPQEGVPGVELILTRLHAGGTTASAFAAVTGSSAHFSRAPRPRLEVDVRRAVPVGRLQLETDIPNQLRIMYIMSNDIDLEAGIS